MQVVVKLVVGRPGMWPDRQPGASGPNGHRLGLGTERELTGVSGPWEGVNSRPGLRIVPSPPPPLTQRAVAYSLEEQGTDHLTGQLQKLGPFLAKILAPTQVLKKSAPSQRHYFRTPPRGKGAYLP